AQTCWTTWPQPIPCLSAIQWHGGKEGSQPEKDMDEEQYIMSGMTSLGSGILQWQRTRAQTYWTTLLQPILHLSRIPMACEEDYQLTREGHERGTVY
uniref:Envelope glycoprotein n=1 Tax=Mesocestoides corti TaxID=53468 RepID=A0A5K3F2F6_MESCO